MTAWEKMIEQQKQMQKRFERLLPDMNYINSIKKNFAFMNSIVKPHQDLVAQLQSFNHLIESPAMTQIHQMTSEIKNILPNYSETFLLSSSVFEAYKHSSFIIPDYLKEFRSANKSILDSTKILSTRLEALTNVDFKKPIIFDNIPDLLISPILSGSAHFQTLKNLDYYDLEIYEETEEDYTEIIDENSSLADRKIETVNKDWLILLKGAEYSLLSKNPDKVRHTITSLRELMTQILHHFAPDSEVKKEFTDPKYYHNGRPTRRTRLQFILNKKYQNATLLEVIDADITACLALFDLYQEGTHKIVSTIGDDELLFILKRTKLSIEQLI